ncbi:hypothetical protein ABXW79_07660 [Lactobacillus delbrueckii subsp. bulgaricus]|uniref:hypothetical protein n=1 Tax=Lactobacillus delbrueckii TaxID=1584 RepID=UPI0034A09C9D
MKYFIWAYNPKVVSIRPSQGISFVVPETKTEAYLELERQRPELCLYRGWQAFWRSEDSKIG